MRKTGRRDTRRGCPGADVVIAFIIYWCVSRDMDESPAWSESLMDEARPLFDSA
jgi:hypothetical protein